MNDDGPNAVPWRWLRMLAVAASILVWTPFTGGFAAWPTEAGAIEWHSFCILILCAFAFLVSFPARMWPRYVHVVTFSLLLAKREGESDWWIVDERLLDPAFFAAEGMSITALVGAAIALLFVASVGTLVFFGLPATWRAIRSRKTWPVLLGLAGAFALAGQLVEEVVMQPLSALAGPWFAAVCEETAELIFAILLFEAILAAARGEGAARSGLSSP